MANSPRKNQLDPFHDDDYGDCYNATEYDHDTGDDTRMMMLVLLVVHRVEGLVKSI